MYALIMVFVAVYGGGQVVDYVTLDRDLTQDQCEAMHAQVKLPIGFTAHFDPRHPVIAGPSSICVVQEDRPA